MDHQHIIDLYWQRSEAAITQSDVKYAASFLLDAQQEHYEFAFTP